MPNPPTRAPAWPAAAEKLGQITAPHFCAGMAVRDERVTDTAPIVSYMRGWTVAQVRAYCARKRWELTRVS